MRGICDALRQISKRYDDIEILFPVHPNPHVQQAARSFLQDTDRIHLTDPIAYVPFVHLMKKTTLLLTDSGGIQEEAPALNKPVVVMRDVTERPEGIEAGTTILAGTSTTGIVSAVSRLLDDRDAYAHAAAADNPYGDGHASERIAEYLASSS